MSKINEINEIAQYQADVILETLKEQVEWSIADYDLSGDDYYNLRDYTVYKTVIKLLEKAVFLQMLIITNKIRLSLDNINVTNKNK